MRQIQQKCYFFVIFFIFFLFLRHSGIHFAQGRLTMNFFNNQIEKKTFLPYLPPDLHIFVFQFLTPVDLQELRKHYLFPPEQLQKFFNFNPSLFIFQTHLYFPESETSHFYKTRKYGDPSTPKNVLFPIYEFFPPSSENQLADIDYNWKQMAIVYTNTFYDNPGNRHLGKTKPPLKPPTINIFPFQIILDNKQNLQLKYFDNTNVQVTFDENNKVDFPLKNVEQFFFTQKHILIFNYANNNKIYSFYILKNDIQFSDSYLFFASLSPSLFITIQNENEYIFCAHKFENNVCSHTYYQDETTQYNFAKTTTNELGLKITYVNNNRWRTLSVDKFIEEHTIEFEFKATNTIKF